MNSKTNDLAGVVRKVGNAIQRINHYPADSVVCFVKTYPLDSDLSGGERYPAFEQLEPGFVIKDYLKVLKLFPVVWRYGWHGWKWIET